MLEVEKLDKLHIIVTDVWSDRNKGDAAMNVATIQILKNSFPSADISVCSLFGANQMYVAIQESFLTRKENISSFIGGLFPTYHEVDVASDGRVSGKLWKTLVLIRCFLTIGFETVLLLAVFFNLRKVLTYLLPREFRRSLNVFSSADLVVSRRSIVPSAVSMGKNSLYEPYFLFKELFHICLAIVMKKPLALLGQSIWPSINPLSRKLVKWVLDKSILVTLREEVSYDYIKQLGVDESKVYVLPDLSFWLYNKGKAQLKPYPRNRVKPVIGFTFVDWQAGGRSERDNYISVMADFIRYVTNVHNCKVIIVSQVVYPPQDSREIAQLIATKSRCKDIEFIWGDFSLKELFELYSQLDFVIATPLHSGIFSLCVGTPAIMIAYDGGPKHVGTMKMLEMQDCVLPYENLSLQHLIDLFNNRWQERVLLHRKALEKVEALKYKVLLHGLLLRHIKVK